MARMSPPTPPAPMHRRQDERGAAEGQPFSRSAGNAALERPVRELGNEEQSCPEDRRPPVDRSLPDDEEHAVLGAGERERPGQDGVAPADQSEHQEEDGREPERSDQRSEAVRAQHHGQRPRREDQDGGPRES